MNGNFDHAFRLYVEAAKAYLALANNAANEKDRVKSKSEAKKCLERAEKIKAAKKDTIKPIIQDHFSSGKKTLISTWGLI